jgi:hypothetical protein
MPKRPFHARESPMTPSSASGWIAQRRRVWRETVARDPGQDDLVLFDKLALRVYWWTLIVAPSWLLIDARERFQTGGKTSRERQRIRRAMERAAGQYGALWCTVLVAAWLVSPDSEPLAAVLACTALFRLIEIGNTILGFVLDRREPLLAGSLVTVALQALQIALIFAIVDHAFARHDFVIQGGTRAGQAATTPLEFLYMSSTTMITLGNQYAPETSLAQWLELGTAAAGIVLLAIVLARAIGLLGGQRDSGDR